MTAAATQTGASLLSRRGWLPVRSISAESCILLSGLAFLLFSWLPGLPLRLEQFDLPKDVALGTIGLVCAIDLLLRQDIPWQTTLDAPVGACLCWGAALTWTLATNEEAAWRAIGSLAAAASLFLLARRVGAKAGIETMYLMACVLAFIVSVLVLMEAFGVMPFISVPGRRPGATLGNRNLAARIACLSLPLLWRQFALSDRSAQRLAIAMMVAVTTAAIVISRSRAAMLVGVMLLIGLPALALHLAGLRVRKHVRRTGASWFAAAFIGAGVAVLIPNRLGWLPSDFARSARALTNYQSGTGRGRIIQALTTWRMIRSAPAQGVGPGNWSVVYPHYAPHNDPSVRLGAFYPGPQVPRNDILSFTAEFGVPGFVLALISIAALLARAGAMLRSDNTRREQIGLMIVATCVAAAILGLFDSVVRVAPTVALVALTMGLAVGEDAARAHDAPDSSSRSSFARQALMACYALASFVFAHAALQDLNALRAMRSATTVDDLYRAVRVAPDNVEARMLLAYLLAEANRCDLARPHLVRAAARQPFSIAVTSLRDECEKQLGVVRPAGK